jgi:hypothetical protein
MACAAWYCMNLPVAAERAHTDFLDLAGFFAVQAARRFAPSPARPIGEPGSANGGLKLVRTSAD